MNEGIKQFFHQFLHPQRIIEEKGTVVEIRPKRLAIVECASKSACSGCGAAGNCCQSGPGANTRRIMADNIPCARVGDNVRVEIETSAGILDSESVQYIVAFVMLALGLGLGYGIASIIAVGMPAAALSVLMGLAFMCGALGILRFGRKAVVQTALARIVEIEQINPEDKA
jgi:positive regulator of sigma E activity